ncbi:flagellar hook-length control protein FliK [Pseudovibrio sp. Tun.PSC04-5.I4]|uniref:flagellar hook-length control protein FliK n=1 Tax=Pseudovibrio sp. Tun.PSC04-5.I4 TaxID=1798213 RepID=UPI000881BFD4|nr:flagellar hook-length control protein FliK [Pseudovibrio sp. Tun.PSC04-5.I4]SDR33870.1 hook-length control protein FliK [Pseudovibrio sp. Tun.PSC04-5.I4]
MSQSALLGLSGSVQPQTTFASVIGQSGNALLGTGVQGSGQSVFGSLLGATSAVSPLVLQELPDVAGVSKKNVSAVPVLNADLTTEVATSENGENAVVGLAASLPVEVVSALSNANITLKTAPQTTAANQISSGNAAPDVVLQGVVQNKAKQSFVPVPTIPVGAPISNLASDRSVVPQPDTGLAGEVAEQIDETSVLKAAPDSVAPVTTTNVKPAQSSALPRELVDVDSRQDLPEIPQQSSTGVSTPLSAESEKTALVLPNVGRKETDPAVPLVQPTFSTETENREVELAEPVAFVRAPEKASLTVDVQMASDGKSEVVDVVAKTQNLNVQPAVHNSEEVEQVDAPSRNVVDAGLKKQSSEAPAVNPATNVSNAEVTAEVGGQKPLSELVRTPDVQSIAVEASKPKGNEVVTAAPIAAALRPVADAVVDVPVLVNEQSLQVEQPIVRRANRPRVDFVGTQTSVQQSARLSDEPQLLFPNVTLKASETVDQQVIKTTAAAQITPPVSGSPVKVSNDVVDIVVRTTAPTVVAPQVRELAKAAQVSPADSTVTGASLVGFEEVEQSVARQVTEHTGTKTQTKSEAPVTVQVKVASAPEQAKTETSIGWGTAFGGLETSDLSADWETADFVAGSTSSSEVAARPVSTLPTSTLRNVASSVWPEIARQANGGATRFEIRLDPKELGGVDVSLEFSKDGRVRAHLIVERPETLELLQRDQRGLEKALQDAGVDSDKSSLQFSLRREGGGSQNRFEEHRDNQQDAFGEPENASGEASLTDLSAAAQQNINRSSNASGLDISV